MSEIHKIVCDMCAREKDLNNYGSKITFVIDSLDWQKLHVRDPRSFYIKRIDVCSLKCLSAYIEKRNKEEKDAEEEIKERIKKRHAS